MTLHRVSNSWAVLAGCWGCFCQQHFGWVGRCCVGTAGALLLGLTLWAGTEWVPSRDLFWSLPFWCCQLWSWDTSVSLICRASPWAAAVWVKMCLPLLAQRNSLFCCLSLWSLKLQGIDSWRSFWLSVGANALLKFKCVWGLIPRFTELIREKTSNDFSNLLEPVYNKVVAGRMWTSAVLGRPTEQKGLFSDMQQGEGRAVLPSLCSLGMVSGSHAPIVFMLIDILVLSWVDDSRGLWQ